MSSPDLVLQAAVRAALIATPAIIAQVPAVRIRAGSIRGDAMPAILLGYPRVSINGRAAGAQTVARIDMMLHLWADASDAETAQAIGGAVLAALMDAPEADGVWFDGWDRPSLAWAPDPAGTHVHGAVSLSCVARWRP